MNYLLTVCFVGEECPTPDFIPLWILIPLGILGFVLIHIGNKRKEKELKTKEDNIKHWKQIGVNKPRRDFHG